MMMFAVFCALAGMVLGLRFKVLVLLPAIACAIAAGAALGLAERAGLATTVLETLAAVVALQLGYLGGVGTRFAIALTRVPRLSPTQGSSEPAAP